MKKPEIDSVWKTNTMKTAKRHQVMRVYQKGKDWRVSFMVIGKGDRGDLSLQIFNDCFEQEASNE